MRDQFEPADPESECELIDQLAERFTAELQGGLSPEIEDYALKYPELADQIRELFPALKIIAKANSQATPAANTHPRRYLPEQTVIGDYKIIRKIGQGGMGVVYEAHQQSLGRRVALKLLPYAVVHNEKFVERFRREARAAAKLHHTNIVPVFDVGQEQDTLFYAMQFIEGQGLDEIQRQIAKIKSDQHNKSIETVSKLISGTSVASGSEPNRNDFFKTVARVGISVSDALNYSHQRSMIHRDVKPSNLILDTSGVVWLTDFGLVKTLDSELTETGDFVGTARYMSPERFKGSCDARADIYGLGITLYELVTGRIAYEANDRMHLLDQIANEEPLKPRQVDRNIPLDLETIILKAMEKDPRKRYQVADDLTQDLIRFVDDQPIHARRASLVERSIRWVRRHKAQAATFASLALLSIVLVVSSLLIWQQRMIAEKNLKDAVNEKMRADQQSEFAKAEMQKARDAVSKMLSAVGDIRLRNVPMMDGIRRQLLEEALEFNRQYLVASDDPAVLSEAGHAHERIAKIYVLLERTNDALKSYGESNKLFEQVAKLDPENVDALQMVAANRLDMGALFVNDKNQAMADHYLLLARDNYQELSILDSENTEYLFGLARAYQLIGLSARISSDNKAFEENLTTAKTILVEILAADASNTKFRFEYARTFAHFGNMYWATGRLQKGIEAIQNAIDIISELTEEFPAERNYKESLADYMNMYGSAQLRAGKVIEAKKAFEQTVEIYTKLAKQFPQVPNYLISASVTQNGLAVAYAINGEPAKALEQFQLATNTIQQVVDVFPGVAEYRYQLAQSKRRLGVHYLNINKPSLALDPFKQSFELLTQLNLENPAASAYVIDRAECAFLVAQTTIRMDLPVEDGIQWVTKAIKSAQMLSAKVSDEPEYRHKLAKYIRMKSMLLTNDNQKADAQIELNRAIEIQRTLVERAPQFIEYHRHLAISLEQLAELMLQTNKLHDAETHCNEALEIRKQNCQRSPNRPDHVIETLVSMNQLSEILIAKNNSESAQENLSDTIEYAKRMMIKYPGEFRFRDQCLIAAKLIIPILYEQQRIEQCKAIYKTATDTINLESNSENPNQNVLGLGKEIVERWDNLLAN